MSVWLTTNCSEVLVCEHVCVHGVLQETGISHPACISASCSWDSFQIHWNPDQDQVVTEYRQCIMHVFMHVHKHNQTTECFKEQHYERFTIIKAIMKTNNSVKKKSPWSLKFFRHFSSSIIAFVGVFHNQITWVYEITLAEWLQISFFFRFPNWSAFLWKEW